MWFKTRIGLVSLPKCIEIKAWQSAKTGNWNVGAHLKNGLDVEVRSLFRRQKLSTPWFWLACFRDSPSVQGDIARVFAAIEASVTGKQMICDLSQVGQADAWDKVYHPIAWP